MTIENYENRVIISNFAQRKKYLHTLSQRWVENEKYSYTIQYCLWPELNHQYLHTNCFYQKINIDFSTRKHWTRSAIYSFGILISIQNKSFVTFNSFGFGIRKKGLNWFLAYWLWNKGDTVCLSESAKPKKTYTFVHSFHISYKLWHQRRMFHLTYCPKSAISMLPKKIGQKKCLYAICNS